jgi:CHASE2 domain-containing sensor protein
MNWFHFKEWLESTSGLDMDALHVHAGVLVQLLVALLARRSLRSPWPWLAVLAAAAANEAYDLFYETWPNRDTQWAESVKDLLNTIALPTLLLLVARFAPALMVGRATSDQKQTSVLGR